MSAFPRNGASAYRQTEAQSRTPLELVVMLYDGALRFLAQARAAIERKDVRARHEAVSRTLAIVSELQNTLDMDKGREISSSLDALYSYVMTRIVQAAAKQDAALLDDAVRVLKILREGWVEVAQPGAAAANRTSR